MSEIKIENKDFIYVGDSMLTVGLVEARFEEYRRQYFDQPLESAPVVEESKRGLRPENRTLEEQEYLDYAPYDFEDPVHEKRFQNEFDFHSALLRATAANTDRLFKLKRQISHDYYSVRAQYTELFASEYVKYGKSMGGNDNTRQSWFLNRYPALAEINRLYEDFLSEVQIEIDRLQQFSASTSRALAATENSYRARGLLFDKKVVGY